MSQRPFPLSYQRLLLSDSETESDDLSEIFYARARLTNKRGKSTAKQSRKGKRNNKEKRNEEGCAKALKEDPVIKMLRRRCPLSYQHLLVSDSETESDDLTEMCKARARLVNMRGKSTVKEGRKGKIKHNEKCNEEGCGNAKEFKGDRPELLVVKLAEDYQELMKKIPIPTIRRSDAMFITWHSLANSMKQFYGQPLHYLTYVLVKQWDQSRIGTVDEEKPMDTIIHSRKAESTIWDVEEVHRRCTSHIHLAKLWVSDPDYRAVVGDAIPSSKLVT